MGESKNTYIPSSPENLDSQENIHVNIQNQENIPEYGENLRNQQESIHIMERIETLAFQHPNKCLNFDSSDMTRYFQILAQR